MGVSLSLNVMSSMLLRTLTHVHRQVDHIIMKPLQPVETQIAFRGP